MTTILDLNEVKRRRIELEPAKEAIRLLADEFEKAEEEIRQADLKMKRFDQMTRIKREALQTIDRLESFIEKDMVQGDRDYIRCGSIQMIEFESGNRLRYYIAFQEMQRRGFKTYRRTESSDDGWFISIPDYYRLPSSLPTLSVSDQVVMDEIKMVEDDEAGIV